MQPDISLSYDSGSGIGPLGVGWSLGGLDAITRCNLTVAQDTTPAPVQLVASDGYCINGNRLRLTGGAYGTAGSTYQTEIADFSQITAVGNTTSGGVNTGPASFTVQGRNGLTYYYGLTDSNGNGANSQALAWGNSTALSWFLSKIVDRSGNNLVIDYLPQAGPSPTPPTIALSGTTVPAKILWTPVTAGSSSYTYTMQFNYSPSPNAPQSSINKFVAGTPVVNAELLTSIEILIGTTTVVKDYFLTYQASPLTERNELIKVKECADSAGSNCLLPTTMSYEAGSPGLSTVSNSALTTSSARLSARYDLNGDGYPDLVYIDGTTLYVAFGSVSGYGTPINTGVPGGGLIGNILGGSQDGILAVNSGVWWYYAWNGSSFVGTPTGLAYDSTALQYQLADVDGDGRADLVALYITGPFGPLGKYTATVYTRLNTSTGSTPSFSSTLNTASTFGLLASAQLLTPDMQYAKLRRYDFNGDGRDDIVLQTITGTSASYTVNTYELISTGTTFNSSLIQSTAASNYPTMFFTDWNDDKCTDIVTFGTLYVSGCNGTAPVSYAIGTVVAAIDYDGDGRTDLLVANGSTLGVYLSKATGAPTLTTTSIPYSSNCTYIWMDANGDGLDDLGCWSGTSPYPLTYYLHNGTSDLATSFADGYGNSASPLYVPITEGSYAAWNDQVFPNQNYLGPLYVVYQTTFSDPSTAGGTYQQTFFYAGAALNLQGRGFAGFGAQQRFDSRNGIWDTAEYGRVFPYTGMLTYDIQAQDNLNTKPIKSVTNTLNTTTLDGTMNNQRVFPYTSNGKIQNYEVGGAENADLITTTSTTYTFDNYGNATTIAKTVTDNDPGSPNPNPYFNDTWTSTTVSTIAPDTSTWCNSLPTEVDTTNTAPGVPAITRHSSFTPDYSLCRETQQVVEAGNSTYQVTTGYGFDAFGNINSQTVTGIGMAARTTAINWGTTGQFPTQVTNPLSQISYPSFDPVTGQLLSFKDPNGITTSWQYDPFGRKNKEIRPDGTYTVWSYNDCTVWDGGGCLYGPHSLALGHSVYSTTGVVQSVGSDWFDQVDRPIIKNAVNIAGTFDRSDVRYDNLGHIAQQSMPCAYSAVLTPCTYWITNSHDALGRVTQTQRPISATNSTLQTTMIQYSGRTTTITDPQGKVTTNITKVTGSVGRTEHGHHS